MSKIDKDKLIDDLEGITNKLEINNSYNQLIYDYINKGDDDYKKTKDLRLYYLEMQRNKGSYINLLNEMFDSQKKIIEKLNQILDDLMK